MKEQMIGSMMSAKRYDEALRLIKQVLHEKPENAQVHYQAGHCCIMLGDLANALVYMKKTAELDTKHINSRLKVAEIAYELANVDEMFFYLEQVEALEEGNKEALEALGQKFFAYQFTEDSLRCFQKAYLIDPGSAQACYMIAVNLQSLGQFVEAKEYAERALDINPQFAACYYLLANIRRHEEIGEQVSVMEQLYNSDAFKAPDRYLLGFALGKVFSDVKEYDKAFSYFSDANNMLRSMSPDYSVAAHEALFGRIAQTFTTDFISQRQGAGEAGIGPIFIVGLPRSGSTLVEQILSCHSDVCSGGEMGVMGSVVSGIEKLSGKPICEGVRELDAETIKALGNLYIDKSRAYNKNPAEIYIVDKMPNNFMWLGLIKIILPNSKFIHVARNPVDTCFSIYKTSFAGHYPYSNNLEELAAFYALYNNLMKHWHNVLPYKIYDVEYEALIENTEEEVRALLNFCGLKFESACLTPHLSLRDVRTNSSLQVRSPIYKGAVEGWKPFANHIQPLLQAFSQ
ncbi:sulfotransferase [Oceanicoccus sp. KOV_DT_Chl]|uniref:tetratricopeptide repeat-containing sulfotransferase family protein n=1 Tax=Oceanicoccus sp. KOV_DT_Chl TaxID=1904639 RepID=UPI000C79AA62|nr:sulfotransferase [Oceanicoccus sp. KOV_DT_Chl]